MGNEFSPLAIALLVIYTAFWVSYLHWRVKTERTYAEKARAFMESAKAYDAKGEAAWARADKHLEDARKLIDAAKELNLLFQKAVIEGDKQSMDRLVELNLQSAENLKMVESLNTSAKRGH